MKIIDAHIHTNFEHEKSAMHAKELGVNYSWSGLHDALKESETVGAIIITTDTKAKTPGERELLLGQYAQSRKLFPVYSIHPDYTEKEDLKELEKLLEDKSLFGIKIFPGYHPVFPSDRRYHKFYEFASSAKIPVIIHTGDTFGSENLVKYAHPLDVDEMAVKFRKTNFILAHLGNPWVRTAAELVYKNENVYTDLSAFCICCPTKKDVKRIKKDIRWAIEYSASPDKFIYGSDWPLIGMAEYREVIETAVPKKYHEAIFFDNANKLFNLKL